MSKNCYPTIKQTPGMTYFPTHSQWLKWSCEARGLTWLEQIPYPFPHPTNFALFGHKITLYIQSWGSYYCRGFKSEQGAEPPGPLTLTTAQSMAVASANRHRHSTLTLIRIAIKIWRFSITHMTSFIWILRLLLA